MVPGSLTLGMTSLRFASRVARLARDAVGARHLRSALALGVHFSLSSVFERSLVSLYGFVKLHVYAWISHCGVGFGNLDS